MQSFFSKFAYRTADLMGSSKTFFLALMVVLAWAVSGPLFGFSDTWQLVINTGTTIFTFLIVILIQHAQNHDSKAVHLKLDELIRAVHSARNSLVDLEAMTDEEMEKLHQEFQRVRATALERNKGGSTS
ncbi:MAG TPA: low affinity iron permease family protein [Candidatus Eisenbacteria bacterium]|jgi:low affinity Fe/Cu permease|nr:low affinity iron permease family protein [Candidatus Eisenbacteria bacterium]